MSDTTDGLWADLAERVRRDGRVFELPIRFSGDPDGLAPSTLILGAEGPRVLLSVTAREKFNALDAVAVAARMAEQSDRESWLSSFREIRQSQRPLSLNEACRVVYGPVFRTERTSHNYNAYVEFRADPQIAADWFPGSVSHLDVWPSLGELRASWNGTRDNDRHRPGAPGLNQALSPSRKRAALDSLKADRLRELVREFSIDVDDLRDRQGLVAGLADGRRIDFRSVLSEFSREELKAACQAIAIEPGSGDKNSIVDRILGGEARLWADGKEPGENGAVSESQTEGPSDAAPFPPARASPVVQGSLSARDKRAALGVLKIERLREFVRQFGLEVDGLNRRDALIVSLADGRRVDFPTLLSDLSRDELLAICEELDLGGPGARDRASLIARVLGGRTSEESDDDEAEQDEPSGASRQAAVAALARLASAHLTIESPGNGWPATGTVVLAAGPSPVTVYVRSIGRSGRSRPAERRFQNPGDKATRAIREPSTGYALLLGVWHEQGDDRAVVVAMDAYRRLNQDTRVSLFMPLSLLEEAADTGYAEHRSQSGEIVYAFRPQNLPAYVDRLIEEAGFRPGQKTRGQETATPTVVAIAPPPAPAPSEGSLPGHVQIRPKVGMYAAFARLNYKPWFALAEFVDNAIQSFLSTGGQPSSEPLKIDIRIDEDEIVITDRAGGISKSDFPRAFSPSQPPPDAMGLSEFGLGMKAAACWFAREWTVRTAARGEGVERTISFDVPRITREGIEVLPVAEKGVEPDAHYTVVTLSNLRVRPKGRTLAKIRDHLSGIYRVLMGKGVVVVRLSTGRTSEVLAYEQPKLLHAPYFREPDGAPREWKREFEFALDSDRRIWGWAGLLETGSASRAGFSVFRRDRLIQGSADETYRPAELFRSPNSYTYQRLTGELFVDGFAVSHTKDGIQWEGLEEAVVSRLKMELSHWDLPILQQAEGYRARRRARDLEAGFGLAAVASTGAVLSSQTTGDVLSMQLDAEHGGEAASDAVETTQRTDPEQTLTKRTFTVNVRGSQLPWCVTIELISDRAAEWFDRGSETKIEERSIHVLVNLAHPFSEQFINDAEATLAPILRIVCGLALAEETARESGVRQAGIIRRHLNQLLRDALGALAREDEG